MNQTPCDVESEAQEPKDKKNRHKRPRNSHLSSPLTKVPIASELPSRYVQVVRPPIRYAPYLAWEKPVRLGNLLAPSLRVQFRDRWRSRVPRIANWGTNKNPR